MATNDDSPASLVASDWWVLTPPPDAPSEVRSTCNTVNSLIKRVIEEVADATTLGWPFSQSSPVASAKAENLRELHQRLLRAAWLSQHHKAVATVSLKSLPTWSAWAVGSSIDPEFDSLAVPLLLVIADAVDTLAHLLGEGVVRVTRSSVQQEPSE